MAEGVAKVAGPTRILPGRARLDPRQYPRRGGARLLIGLQRWRGGLVHLAPEPGRGLRFEAGRHRQDRGLAAPERSDQVAAVLGRHSRASPSSISTDPTVRPPGSASQTSGRP